jgi:hypothetical protein
LPGDQFLLRDGVVYGLTAETSRLESRDVGLEEFFERVSADPVEYLSLEPLVQFHRDGGKLQPGNFSSCSRRSARGNPARAEV